MKYCETTKIEGKKEDSDNLIYAVEEKKEAVTSKRRVFFPSGQLDFRQEGKKEVGLPNIRYSLSCCPGNLWGAFKLGMIMQTMGLTSLGISAPLPLLGQSN